MARVDGEEFGSAGLAVGVDDLDRVEFEVFDNGNTAVRVSGYMLL